MLDTNKRSLIQPAINYIAKQFIKAKITPNQITMIALLLGVGSSIIYYYDLTFLAVIIFWLSGLFDVLDGSVARLTKSSDFGTVMDVVFDRIVELSIIIAVAIKYPSTQFLLVLLTSSIVISMTIFLAVGAISDKASMKSFYYQPGLIERTEGFIFFTLIMVFPSYINYFIIAFSIGILITAIQRFLEAKRILTNE